jgi:drug/metabolite transporter (DMT)-like permease
MNGGIVASIISLNTGFVIVMAYFMFKESFGKVQYIAVILLVTSVVLVTLFPPENITSRDDVIIPGGASGADGNIKIRNSDMSENVIFYNKALLIGGGLVASVSFGSQLLIFKLISLQTKDTFGIGFGFLFTCGILGLISLVI